ncbi:MAG TPA: class I SAM-dependent methyltransferase [Solirubrobacterales bacterium]|nr:class I SAM-dependent methyltransferase [Solirubrobacterales bacterium]
MEKAAVGSEQPVPKVAVHPENEEATEAWSGVLFDRFLDYRDLVVGGLGAHGDAAMALEPPEPGDRVLDIGCGFGDTTQQLAALVGADGHATGVDVSEPFIEASIAEARGAGVDNVDFFATDVQVGDLRGPYDYAFSRMGVMFFANPVQALRNIREALRPGGRLVAVVWRRKLDNEWLHRAEQVTEKYLEEPEEPEDVRCGPGPFSMANADTVSEQLQIAGFERATLTRCDLPIRIGNDLDHAVEFNMALGPAAELLRICPADEVERLRPKVNAEIREVLADYQQPDGEVRAPASTWIVRATAPE